MSGSYIAKSFSAVKVQFQLKFRVLYLPGHGIVLGCDWMTKHNPVSFSYDPRKLTLL